MFQQTAIGNSRRKSVFFSLQCTMSASKNGKLTKFLTKFPLVVRVFTTAHPKVQSLCDSIVQASGFLALVLSTRYHSPNPNLQILALIC